MYYAHGFTFQNKGGKSQCMYKCMDMWKFIPSVPKKSKVLMIQSLSKYYSNINTRNYGILFLEDGCPFETHPMLCCNIVLFVQVLRILWM